MQKGLFDLPEGEARKEKGMALAATSREFLLEKAREIAKTRARLIGEVTMDDVQEILALITDRSIGNAAGSVFRGPEWVFTGRWQKSTRVTNHARMNRVWRLK